MYHSITFGDKNTWDDWSLIPNGRPAFVPPTQKTNYIDIPGGDGSLDMSEVLTGYPVYNNREGSFNFVIMNKGASMYPDCTILDFDDAVSQIMNHLHGKTMKAVLEDDPLYEYEGRFFVNGITPGADWSTIEIGYNVKPYKHLIASTIDAWLWDPFNFKTGVITSSLFSNITVNTLRKKISLNKYSIGQEPVSPKFVVTSTNGQGVYIRLVNTKLGLDITNLFQNGESKNTDYILYDETELYLYTSSGTGTVSIVFNQGSL